MNQQELSYHAHTFPRGKKLHVNGTCVYYILLLRYLINHQAWSLT